MYRPIAYIQFLFTSVNHHGIHSPFIFRYLTRCLYKPAKLHKTKAFNILLKSISYFGTRSVKLQPENDRLATLITRQVGQDNIFQPPYDLLYSEFPDPGLLQRLLDQQAIHNDTLYIADNIRKTSEARKNWEKIKRQEEVRVTVDSFRCGLVFFRKEQARQHFKIRI